MPKDYPADEGCAHCGISHEEAKRQGYIEGEELLSHLTCPECYRDGCDVCMPMGRGCMCPECEEAPDA